MSKGFPLSSGVPQGSNLGPILFLIFINDLGKCIEKSDYKLLADDLKLFRPPSYINDGLLLQKDLEGLSSWREDNFLPRTQQCLSPTDQTEIYVSLAYLKKKNFI